VFSCNRMCMVRRGLTGRREGKKLRREPIQETGRKMGQLFAKHKLNQLDRLLIVKSVHALRGDDPSERKNALVALREAFRRETSIGSAENDIERALGDENVEVKMYAANLLAHHYIIGVDFTGLKDLLRARDGDKPDAIVIFNALKAIAQKAREERVYLKELLPPLQQIVESGLNNEIKEYAAEVLTYFYGRHGDFESIKRLVENSAVWEGVCNALSVVSKEQDMWPLRELLEQIMNDLCITENVASALTIMYAKRGLWSEVSKLMDDKREWVSGQAISAVVELRREGFDLRSLDIVRSSSSENPLDF